MIDINLTLIVQIVHFIIAYWLIKLGILKPLLNVIVQRNEYDARIKEHIASHTHQIATKEQEKRALWVSFQRFFSQHNPTSSSKPEPVEQAPLLINQPDPQLIKIEQQRLKERLLKAWEKHV